ncbi:SagB/ThcOx family dehydrogenase [Actinoalloteichus hymeniacidonis]|uniref:SagB-type dehydrogenase domain n=1 Tax=Actinoalloteichus hymeniacidonis TaxID=340345 RepID=A0AAC9MZ32_9PSEU|nr:SagB/ThcOx family dehydrogenase [Actinoalloteichus hymeniacidonis]AOS63511.1 SagB-type dehydrogenase domain [Actinoalloteichus hymeniacidonis]MBB5908445.1 SagB-type dehydrogenase family enzyme [Actinoalloteichus hymeniacidonis]
MEYRRSRSLVLYWHDGELTVENYLEVRSTDVEGDNAVAIDEEAVALLSRFDDFTDVEDVVADFPEHEPDSVRGVIKDLAEDGLLLTRQQTDREDRFLDSWGSWGEEARYFHFGTRNALYSGDSLEQRRSDARWIRETGGDPPAIFKSYPDAPRVYLPRIPRRIDEDFLTVLTRRRTHRVFTGEQVRLADFAAALFYTFAPMQLYDAGDLGTLMLRTSPCGGARHELEGYVGVFDVQGVQPGLYHYNAECHALELIDGDFDRERLHRLTYESEMCTPSAFVCFVTAVYERTMYKYRHSRAYRVTLLSAGHLGQTFVLTNTALGLGAWQTAAFRDDELDAALGVDGFTEGVLYMFGAGHPVYAPDGMPAGISRAGLVDGAALMAPRRQPDGDQD